MNENEGKWTATTLSPEQQVEFEEVKAYHGLQSNSEALRFLIRKESRQIREAAPLFALVGEPQ